MRSLGRHFLIPKDITGIALGGVVSRGYVPEDNPRGIVWGVEFWGDSPGKLPGDIVGGYSPGILPGVDGWGHEEADFSHVRHLDIFS